MLTILNGYSVLAELNDVFLSQFLLLYRIKGYICTFSLMTDLTRCRWCWPRNSRWTQIRLSKHIVHSSRGGQRGDREGRGGQKGGQRGVLEEGNGHFLCSVLQQTNFLVRLAPVPEPRHIDKDLSALVHSLRHNFYSWKYSNTLTCVLNGAFIHRYHQYLLPHRILLVYMI